MRPRPGWLAAAALLVGLAVPGQADAALPAGCGSPALRTVHVSDSGGLKHALAGARAGDRIVLSDGRYVGNFVLRASGTPSRRIAVCGTNALLDGGSLKQNFGFTLTGSYVDLVGFTVTDSNKGVMVIGARHSVVRGLTVYGIGDEGIHVKRNSQYVEVVGNTVHHTGLVHRDLGEGVYVGSARDNWCDETRCGPDRTDHTLVSGNTFWALGAEAVDVKEGTSYGTLQQNTANGAGSGALAWYDVNGNHWNVVRNTGTFARRDGFLVDQTLRGWGLSNVFSHNSADVHGSGLGFRVRTGNQVFCNNKVSNAAEGFSDVHCTH
jgi:hypothetical protein